MLMSAEPNGFIRGAPSQRAFERLYSELDARLPTL
jgi:hypothetical protein